MIGADSLPYQRLRENETALPPPNPSSIWAIAFPASSPSLSLVLPKPSAPFLPQTES
jgi:hypothetical protein